MSPTTSDRPTPLDLLAVAAGLVPGVVAYAALIGLGMARRGDPVAVSLFTTLLVCGPPLALGLASPHRRVGRFGAALLLWAMVLVTALPVFFPGERRDAVADGLALLTLSKDWESLAQQVADALPDEPALAVARSPMAETVVEPVLPPPSPLEPHQIALPYEGEGSRLSVPVVFEHEGTTLETYMMLDTGATYTTLPLNLLRRLGLTPTADAPELTLHTANGPRQAQVVLADQVWLGDLDIEGVAITTCEDCVGDGHVGLLGLNVTGGYNVTIDADRREVVFSARRTHDRRLDIRPFTDLEARFRRFPGGRVEVLFDLFNRAGRPVGGASAQVECDAQSWSVDLGPVDPGEVVSLERRLPRHAPCDAYRISLQQARW